MVEELNEAARSKDQSTAEPILITTSGTILAGFGRWRLAVFEGRHEVHCIEYPLSEQESLQFILTHHKPRRGWNAFVRIRLALTLEPDLQPVSYTHLLCKNAAWLSKTGLSDASKPAHCTGSPSS